jgi:hypothetical protein
MLKEKASIFTCPAKVRSKEGEKNDDLRNRGRLDMKKKLSNRRGYRGKPLGKPITDNP